MCERVWNVSGSLCHSVCDCGSSVTVWVKIYFRLFDATVSYLLVNIEVT